jgi:hypothetical protein
VIEHCWLRRIAPCSDPATGPGEDMSKQPSVACLTLTPEDMETTAHATPTPGDATVKP